MVGMVEEIVDLVEVDVVDVAAVGVVVDVVVVGVVVDVAVVGVVDGCSGLCWISLSLSIVGALSPITWSLQKS